MNTTTPTTARGTELAHSFTERDAHAFARFFSERTGHRARVAPMTNYDGSLSDTWFRVSVPSRLLARAEDMRAAWDAARADRFDAQDADRYDAMSDESVERSRTLHVEEVGLSDEQARFLKAARAGKVSGWDFASSAVAFCKRLGYVQPEIVGRATKYTITAAGEDILARKASA